MKEKSGVSQVNLIHTGEDGGFIVKATVDPQKPTVPEDLASTLLAVPQSTESREQLKELLLT